MDCSLPCSSVHGIFQARVLERVAISFSRGSSQLRDRTLVSRIAGRHFTIWASSNTWFLLAYIWVIFYTIFCCLLQFSSVQLLSCVCLIGPHELQYSQLPCPSPTPGACSNSCPLSPWCLPTILSSVILLFHLVHHPSRPSSPAFSLSQYQHLFQWVSTSHHVTIMKWSFSFSSSPSNEYSGLISFRIDWFDQSLCCAPETITTVLIGYTPIQNKQLKKK